MKSEFYGRSDEKWNLMLQKIKKTGKRKIIIRKAGAFVSMFILGLGIWFFSNQGSNKKSEFSQYAINEAEISVAVVQNNVYYDEDFGFIR